MNGNELELLASKDCNRMIIQKNLEAFNHSRNCNNNIDLDGSVDKDAIDHGGGTQNAPAGASRTTNLKRSVTTNEDLPALFPHIDQEGKDEVKAQEVSDNVNGAVAPNIANDDCNGNDDCHKPSLLSNGELDDDIVALLEDEAGPSSFFLWMMKKKHLTLFVMMNMMILLLFSFFAWTSFQNGHGLLHLEPTTNVINGWVKKYWDGEDASRSLDPVASSSSLVGSNAAAGINIPPIKKTTWDFYPPSLP